MNFLRPRTTTLRFYCTKANLHDRSKCLVPQTPIKSKIDPSKLPPRTKIDSDTIALLERLSLVDCANKQGIETLEEAIAFADHIQQVDTTDVEPLVTVLEDRPLRTRPDVVTDGNCRAEVLANSAVTEEEYFVAPPGNIPLEARENLLYDELKQRRTGILKVGPTGALLQENLNREWFNSIVINKDIQVFPSANGFQETFNFAKEMCLNILPFGITQFLPSRSQEKEKDKTNFSTYFDDDTTFECWVFTTPAHVTQFFHQWQRERRMWWRKFSVSPGRYVLTDVKNGDGNCQKVEILAQYPWGDQLLETLSLYNEVENIPPTQLEVKDGKKTVQAQCVVSRINSSTMFLNTLCDAYDELKCQDELRPVLRLHRKLSPYKISFSIPSGAKSVVDELKDLALYLCRQLRKNHVSCLLLPSSYKTTLESQWNQYDQMGIPYNLLLNENTIKTGIAQLRSRDTTLKEQVHVTDLPVYVEQLFKNY